MSLPGSCELLFMIHLRGLVLLLLFLLSATRRGLRVYDSRIVAQKQNNALGKVLESSAIAREALIPEPPRHPVHGASKADARRHVGPSPAGGALRAANSGSPRTRKLLLGSHVPGRVGHRTRTRLPVAGLFDGLFGETEEQKAAKEEAFRAQQEMQQRRRNPEQMEEYFKEVEKTRREATAKDAELIQAQKTGDYTAWKQLRAEGKVQSMDETDRDSDSSRLGSDGLIPERIDEKLPFIDAGYVDENQPDIMAGLKKLFGGGDKK